jgi:ABC-transporter N-terminal
VGIPSDLTSSLLSPRASVQYRMFQITRHQDVGSWYVQETTSCGLPPVRQNDFRLTSAHMTSGNFTFRNNDKSAAQLGPGIEGQVRYRDEPAQESTISLQDEKLAQETASSSETASLTRQPTQDEVEERRRGEEIQKLARKYSTRSHQSVYEKNPFKDSADSVLDPTSPNFKPRAFAKSLLNLQARDPEKWKPRTAGISFKDLNVFGFGSATDYQKSVVCLGIV